MKQLLRIALVILAVLALGVLGLKLTGNEHILNGLSSTYFSGKSKPDIDDMRFHALRTVPAGVPQPWAEHLLAEDALGAAALHYMDSLQTAAFLVVYCDTLIYERYGEGFGPGDLINSFSMAKSFTSLAVGAAVDRGLIALDEPVATWLPRFAEGPSSKLTVRHLLQMRSNIDFGESYANPFGYQAKAYFGPNLWEITAPFRVDGKPGTKWKYEGGNTVLLSEVLTAATGDLLSDAFSRDIWQRIGAEQDAFWNLDRENGNEKAFSAFYATARDFAKIGTLMLRNGAPMGQKVLSQEWVRESLVPTNVPDPEGQNVLHYGFQWWLAPPHIQPWHFSARGMRGQYITVLPDEELIIVRMGRRRVEDRTNKEMSPDLPRWVQMGLNLKLRHAERH